MGRLRQQRDGGRRRPGLSGRAQRQPLHRGKGRRVNDRSFGVRTTIIMTIVMIITTITTVIMVLRIMILLIRRRTCRRRGPPHGGEEGHDKGAFHVITTIIMI